MEATKVANGHIKEEVNVIEPEDVQIILEAPPSRNKHLHRESRDCGSLLFYSCIFILLDVLNQVSLYGMKYFNRNVYPLPQTCIVFFMELLKFFCYLLFLVVSRGTQALREVSPTLGCAIPSFCYAINNNIYLYALRFTTPPVWNLLAQSRLILTALTYTLVFKRPMAVVQWAGISLLLLGVMLMNYSGVNGLISSRANTLPTLIYLMLLSACLAVIGNFTMEYMFKNDDRDFSEMQLQVYGFGALATGFLSGIEFYSHESLSITRVKGDPSLVYFLVVSCLICGCASGIAVAFIIKKLDNIVKIYTQALSNIFTSLACALFFPSHFHITGPFFSCMIIITFAISLYESHNLDLRAMLGNLKDAVSFITRGPKGKLTVTEVVKPAANHVRQRTRSFTEA